MIRAIASRLDSPSSGPELTSTPSPGVATPVAAGSGWSVATTTRTGSPNLRREVQVALVVRGHRHDRAGAVVGQHVVGRPHRDPLAVHRVDRVHAQEDAGLLPVGRLPLDVGQLAHLRQVRLELGPLRVGAQLGGQRRVGRDHEERRAEQRVRPGRVDGDRLVAALDHEVDVGAGGPADPVALHGQHPVGPVALQRGGVGQQPVGVLGDLEVPLGQHPADDLGAAALAAAVDDLLVGQHGLVVAGTS